MTSDREQKWIDRETVYPNPTGHYRHREGDAFLLVEDTFRNTFYRFELDESPIVQEFLTDPEWGPASYSVHLIGAIVDLTVAFKRS